MFACFCQMASRVQPTLGGGQGLLLLGLLLLHLGDDRERQEHLVARSVGRRQLPLGERSQVTVHLRFELGLIREPVRQHLPRLFERPAEAEHLLKLRAIDAESLEAA